MSVYEMMRWSEPKVIIVKPRAFSMFFDKGMHVVYQITAWYNDGINENYYS